VHRAFTSAVGAGDTTTPGWAAESASLRGITSEFIENVTRLTVLGQLDYVRVPFLTRTLVETGAFAADWVAQGQPIPMSRATLAAPTMLQMKKVGVLVPFTGELFESWSAATQANLLDSITRAVVFAMNYALLDPSYGETLTRPASVTNGIAPTQSTGSTAAQVTADLKALLAAFSDFSRVLIAMSPSSALHLSQLLTTGGVNAFPAMSVTGGSIWGVPVAVTHAAAQLGSPGSNLVVAIDGRRILVADDGVITAEGSTQAALQFSDTPSGGPTSAVSLYQTNTRALRLIRYLNYERASAGAVAWFPTTGY
jgi:HK97 family phage major capsid protein